MLEPHPVKDPTGKHAVPVLICCLIGMTCFLGVYMRIPVLPIFAAGLGAGTAQVGLINAAFMLSAGLLAVPFGLLSDRIGNRPVLLGGLVLMSGSSFLIPLSTGPLMLGLVYLVFGAGLSAHYRKRPYLRPTGFQQGEQPAVHRFHVLLRVGKPERLPASTGEP